MSHYYRSSECLPVHHKNGENSKELAVIKFPHAEKDRVILGVS